MTSVLLMLAAAAVAGALTPAAAGQAAAPHPGPPRTPQAPPLVETRSETDALRAIFTYSVDGGCNVADTRRLQGGDDVRWADADAALGVIREDMVFRYVDGLRTRLRERRIRLLGELVATGELVCHLRPSGAVVRAWIERHDRSPARRQATRREPLTVRDGSLADLGTYSLSFDPDRDRPR